MENSLSLGRTWLVGGLRIDCGPLGCRARGPPLRWPRKCMARVPWIGPRPAFCGREHKTNSLWRKFHLARNLDVGPVELLRQSPNSGFVVQGDGRRGHVLAVRP